MIYFTADLHLNHNNIIKYCNRPFTNVIEMDNTILTNFWRTLSPGDTLYILGDLSFNDAHILDFFDRFCKINIVVIKGNHDGRKLQKLAKERNIPIYTLLDINIEGQPITLCHYALRVWNKSHFNSWQLYGHSHGTLLPQGKQYDVGVDTNDFAPVSWDRIKEIMSVAPNNFNYIGDK
jgi:calcineurin-like phosphoesterase family protein